jgi:hypothetical protein
MTKNLIKCITVTALLFSLGGCATWSHSSVKKYEGASQDNAPTDPNKIIISTNDITDREYLTLADITATVNKTTVFNKTPTPELVNEQLKIKASKLGADAVILVRYGDSGVSLMSWGSLEGKGRAVKFK